MLWLTSAHIQAQVPYDFRSVEQTTNELYQTGQWKELSTVAREALRQGIDYFYLRVRAGIAYYNLGKYVQAVTQLSAAQAFNDGDRTTLEYLYYSYLMLNKNSEAMSVLDQSPPSLKDYLLKSGIARPHFVNLDLGVFMTDQDKHFRNEDLDGKDNVYGETDIFNQAWYVSAGGRWFPSRIFSGYLGYTNLRLDKNKLAMTGDSLILDKAYHVNQNQIYVNGTIYPGGGFNIVPAIHFINVRQVVPQRIFNSSENTYSFSETTIILNNYIAYCSLNKDYKIIQAGIFGAIANLNEQSQYQAGFDIVLFPEGNLDFYLKGQFIAHYNDGDLQPVINSTLGARLLKPVWVEVSGTFGKTENYFEKNASAVYNFPDYIRFKYELHLIAIASKTLNISLDYQLLGKQAVILTYEQAGNGGAVNYLPRRLLKNYSDHFLIASIKWKF